MSSEDQEEYLLKFNETKVKFVESFLSKHLQLDNITEIIIDIFSKNKKQPEFLESVQSEKFKNVIFY